MGRAKATATGGRELRSASDRAASPPARGAPGPPPTSKPNPRANPSSPRWPALQLAEPVWICLVPIVSLSLSSLADSLVGGQLRDELSTFTRPLESNSEVAIHGAWRIFELALGWLFHFDTYDLVALHVLSHGPVLSFLAFFYGVTPWAAGVWMTIDALSGLLPFLVLRRLSGGGPDAASTAPNRAIVADRGIQATTTVLASLVYGATLFVASKTVLPADLALRLEVVVPQLVAALQSGSLGGFLSVGALMLAFGAAARMFIFNLYAATGRTAADAEVARFDPVRATLGETVWWNMWGYSTRTKVAIWRTAVAAAVTWANTYLQCTLTIKGVEPYGAAVYATAWAASAVLAGLALEIVGDV